MKKNKALRWASGLFVAVMLTTSMISGAFAKYTSEGTLSGNDTATVAKWDVRVGEGEKNKLGSNFEASVNIFEHIYDTKEGNYSTETPKAEETDVATGKIAPGTWGYFQIKVENKSEVKATVSFDMTLSVTTLPLEFSVVQSDSTTATASTWSAAAAGAVTVGNVELGITSGTTKYVTVFWRWAFEDSSVSDRDQKDTELGSSETATTCKVTVKAKATQVD